MYKIAWTSYQIAFCSGKGIRKCLMSDCNFTNRETKKQTMNQQPITITTRK